MRNRNCKNKITEVPLACMCLCLLGREEGLLRTRRPTMKGFLGDLGSKAIVRKSFVFLSLHHHQAAFLGMLMSTQVGGDCWGPRQC